MTAPDLTPFMGTVVMTYQSKYDEQKMVVVFARPGFVPAYDGDRSGQVSCKVDRGKEGRFVPGTQLLITPRQATVKGKEVTFYNPPREYTDGSTPPVDVRRLAQELAGLHVTCTQAANAAYASAGLPVPPGAAGALFIQICQQAKEGGAIVPQASETLREPSPPHGVAASGSKWRLSTPQDTAHDGWLTPASLGDDEIPF